MDLIKNLLLNKLVMSSAVSSLVGHEIYPLHISVVEDPEFPCLTMYDLASYHTVPDGNVNWSRIVFEAHSVDQASDCNEIMDAVKGALHHHHFDDDNFRLDLFEDSDDGIRSVKEEGGEIRHSQKVIYKVHSQKRT